MTNPAIVINAYARPQSLKRLLYSLDKANVPSGVMLVFSLEHGAHEEVERQVSEFNWRGEKVIIRQEKKLGLVGHFLFCGGLTQKYGPIIYLEDDLFVGPAFYEYAVDVLNKYGDDENLAGFSLNAIWFNGYNHLPFEPVDDGGACFFLQVPWYQGQIYTPRQWADFRKWFDSREDISRGTLIHDSIKNFIYKDDWFPIKTRYLVESGKYYAFPRRAHCVNFGDQGTHFKNESNFFQTQLSLGCGNMQFISFKESMAVYDSFYELLPEKLKLLNPELSSFDFETDLNGTKPLEKVKREYVLTSHDADNPIKSYGLEMHPQELNVVYNIQGKHFVLALKNEIRSKSLKLSYKQFFYHHRFKLTRKEKLYFFFKRLFS